MIMTRYYLHLIYFTVLFLCCVICELKIKYRNHTEIELFLGKLEKTHSDIFIRRYSIGKSIKSKELWVLEITSAKARQEKYIPNVKFIGNIHGNEAIGGEVLLHFADFLASIYQRDPLVSRLLNTTRIHILPVMNPDGYEISIEGECTDYFGRGNAASRDLNRAFPDYYKDPRNTRKSYERKNRGEQPEVTAVRKWLKETTFVLSASLHSGTVVANYPYDKGVYGQESIAPDDDVFKYLAKVYANNHEFMYKGDSCANDPDEMRFFEGITNGAKWYSFRGGMQDYNYIFESCMELTLEISCCKYPMAQNIKAIWESNKHALLEYSLQASYGVKGIIKDALTGKCIPKVRLSIVGRKSIFKSNRDGEFWRILLPGQYQLLVRAKGYIQRTINFVVQDFRNYKDKFASTLEINLFNESFFNSTSNLFLDVSPSILSQCKCISRETNLNLNNSGGVGVINSCYNLYVVNLLVAVLFLFHYR